MTTTSCHSSEGEIEIEAIIMKDFTMPESLNITKIPPLASFDYKPDSIRNSKGLTLLGRLDRYDAELQSLRQSLGATETSLETTQTRVRDLESELSSVKLEMITLKQESNLYQTLRNRFLATFRRVILQTGLEKDRATT